MNIFEGYANNYGVLYPLQTFSIAKPVDFRRSLLFLEGNNEFLQYLLLPSLLKNYHPYVIS